MENNRKTNKKWTFTLCIVLIALLTSCASEVSLIHPAKIAQTIIAPQITKSLDNKEALKVFKPEPVFIQQKGPQGTIKSDEKVTLFKGIQSKDLTISMDFNNVIPTSQDSGFKTQALRCADFVKLKVQITGIGIGAPMFPAGVDGNDNIDATAGCTLAATIANVPFGNARIATVAAYQADGTTIIPGSTVKVAFNVTADPTNVTIGFNTTPVGQAVETIIASNAFIGTYLNLSSLQSFIDTETGISGTFPDFNYTFHPSNIDSAQLATDLLGNSGNVGGLTAGDYDNTAFSSVTGTIVGLLGTDTCSIQVTDPASPISINNGNGAFSFTSNVLAGTWVVHAENPNYTADVTPATTIAAGGSDPVGPITFTWANTPNIGSLSSTAEPIGTSININGTDFHPEIAGNTVTFNGVNATVTAASPTQLTVTVPATATDGNVVVTVGTVASNGINFDVMPTVSITAPTNASVVFGTSSAITTNFTSGNSVTNVEFFLDGTGGTSLGTDATSPYTLNWDTTGHTTGAHTLVARITDSAGNQGVSTAINITIDLPPNVGTPTGNTATAPGFGYPIQVTTTSSDDITTLVDGSYTWSCITNCGGGHTFDRTDSDTIIWTAPTSNVGPVTLQVSVDDGVNTAVTDTVVLNYLTGTADVNIIGVNSLEDVSTYAGNGTQGLINGVTLASQFDGPKGMDIDGTGVLYIADADNHVIRKIEAPGIVSTHAGLGTPGTANGAAASAQFENPGGVAVDSVGNVFVADKGNHVIRKIDTGGNVTTFAGQMDIPGFADNTGTLAQFNQPSDIGIDGSDNLYVADLVNNRIRKITPAAVVTTLAGQAAPGFTDNTGALAQFDQPRALDVDGAGNVYVASLGNDAIRKVTSAGVVTTLSGDGTAGLVNGAGVSARFNDPSGVAVDSAGNVYIADKSNHVIRKVTAAGITSTFAGNGTSGLTNGLKTNAQFFEPTGIVVRADDNILVGDKDNHRIRFVKK